MLAANRDSLPGNFEYATALARAYNEWQITEWLDRDDRLRGSVHVAAQDPRSAADEIDRVAAHPQIVQVFLSTLTDSPLAAALGALAVLVTSQVLVTLDAASSVKQYLPTRYWLAWVDFFRDPILWHDIRLGVLVQGAYAVVFLGLAWAAFTTRDVTS